MSQMATMPTNPIIVIPARLASTRLPGKPLADIHGEPMIVHVWRRAIESKIGPVVVACAEAEIADAITKAGGQAVLTKPDHPSGSDRIYEALQIVDPNGSHDAVVNVQGDLPTIAPETIRAAYALLETEGVDIGTLAVEITDASERGNPNVVKAVVERAPGAKTGRALYFTRATAPNRRGAAAASHRPVCLSAGRAGPLRLAAAIALWNSRKSWNNCGHSPQACKSTWPSLTRFRWVSILPPIWPAPASCSAADPILTLYSLSKHPGHVQIHVHRLPGFSRRLFRPVLPHRLSRAEDHAVRDLRGRVRRRA